MELGKILLARGKIGMENDLLEFEFMGEGIEKFEDTVTDLLKKWLIDEHGLDVIVTSFVDDGYGTLIVDCSFDSNNKDKALILTKQLFNELHIKNYNLI